LQAELGAPAAVDNDANVAALGEWSFGAGQGCESLLYITVSTGVGGGWVLGGRIWSGADGMAGEIGHIVVRPGGVPCVCGKAGCVEAEACGWGIAAKVRVRLQDEGRKTKDEGDRLLARAGGRADGVTAQMVAQAAAEGDALAQELLYGAAEALGTGIGAALNLMNPQRVVLGGGITKSGERWWQIVRETARAHALPQTRAEIVPAALGDDAPLWGAAALAQSLIRA
jgi:glucokinase